MIVRYYNIVYIQMLLIYKSSLSLTFKHAPTRSFFQSLSFRVVEYFTTVNTSYVLLPLLFRKSHELQELFLCLKSDSHR